MATDPDPPAAATAWHVRVSGRVQGVGYRGACAFEAQRLGLTGWVRNRRDGSVEALLHGAPDVLARMHDWLQRGPPAARVVRVEVTPVEPPSPPLRRFEHRPTE
jgi:acylphosphatase